VCPGASSTGNIPTVSGSSIWYCLGARPGGNQLSTARGAATYELVSDKTCRFVGFLFIQLVSEGAIHMQEQAKIQQIPVKVYRTSDRLMVAAPMPGLQPEDILVEVTPDGLLVIQAVVRALLKDVKELLLDEWSVGCYYRELS